MLAGLSGRQPLRTRGVNQQSYLYAFLRGIEFYPPARAKRFHGHRQYYGGVLAHVHGGVRIIAQPHAVQEVANVRG